MRLPPLLAVTLATAAVLTGCGSAGPSSRPGVVRVVAAENVWGDIARQVGGRHVEVTSIITSPNTDPHAYDSDPRDAGAIATAQLVIQNGLGYDGFIDKALGAVGGERRVLSVADVLHVSGPDPNPHLWYWTDRLPEVAAAIAEQLGRIDPADRAAFRAAAKRFDRSLRPIRATIQRIRDRYSGSRVGFTERVAGYLLEETGLRVASPASFARAVEDGNDPSPGDTATFDSEIAHHTIEVLIYNAQVVDAPTERLKQLAVSSHVPVVGVTETLPASDASYQAWQLRQDRELLRAIGG